MCGSSICIRRYWKYIQLVLSDNNTMWAPGSIVNDMIYACTVLQTIKTVFLSSFLVLRIFSAKKALKPVTAITKI